jgi:arylsulfatase A
MKAMWALAAAALLLGGGPARAADRPNIILMLADDQAWNGLSVPMHPDVPGSKGDIYRTPNLERLAAQGMRFSAAYAPAPVCSPTRASLQTGKSPARLHWTKAAPPEAGRKLTEPTIVKDLPATETTVGDLLRGAGYATAHYGKWHLRGGGPARHGYDDGDGDTGNEEAYKFTDPNPVDLFGMATRAAGFMGKAKATGQPFYVQLSWHALHAPGNALKATAAKYAHLGDSKRAERAAITEDLDTAVGMVLKSLDELGLASTTYVVYTSDNGAGGGRVLSGGKGDVFEAGIRVPLIVRGPGVAADAWCHTRVVGYDLLPTFCEWAGVPAGKLPKGVEGGSLVPLLSNAGKGAVKRPRDHLVFHFPHYQGDAPHSAVIAGDLKLIRFYEDGRLVLFDLATDLREQHDLATVRPADAARLDTLLTEYLAAVDAQLPTPNPQYDPAKPPPPPKKGGKNKKKDTAAG